MPSISAPLRASATTYSIPDLIQLAQQGRLRLPTFQRPLRWRPKNVVDLFDSIWNGYPIGNLLFWKRPGPEEEVWLGAIRVPALRREDAFYVVDGQQRLAALVSVLLHPDTSAARLDGWVLWFDLDSGKFVRPSADSSRKEDWLPMNRVLDSVALNTWFAEHPTLNHRSAAFQLALQLNKALNEYRVPAYVVDDSNEEVLRVIFTRLNTSGVPMRETEVFSALHHDSGGQPPLEIMARVGLDAGMGHLAETVLLRCLRVIAGDDLAVSLRLDPNAYQGSLPAAVAALGQSIDFLRGDGIRLPHLRLLPVHLPLVLLVGYFHRRCQPSQRERVLLRRWFWRGFVTGRHRDTDNVHLRQMSVLLRQPWQAVLQGLLEDVGRPTPADIEAYVAELVAQDKTRGAALTLVLAVLLARCGPRDLYTGEPLDLGSLLEVAGPQALQQVSPPGEGPQYVLHPWSDDLTERLNNSKEQVKISHCWPSSGVAEDRKKLLTAMLLQELTRGCATGHSDHLPLIDLMGDDAEE